VVKRINDNVNGGHIYSFKRRRKRKKRKETKERG
jgi:hypothetical protein